MLKLVLLRHGESQWNLENRFTGWTDVDLSDTGRAEAENAAGLLIKSGFTFDIAFTSLLIRAINTLNIVLEGMGLLNIPVEKSWRLNERHYGALQGLNKAQTIKKHGFEQVHLWRRGYETSPPKLTKDDNRYPGNDPVYNDIDPQYLPVAESLKDVVDRFMPYWNSDIIPCLKEKKKVLICAHGNSLRALMKHLEDISDDDIPNLEIPTGRPLICELNEQLSPIRHYYLGES